MSFERLNDWLTLIANLGVIAGLVFVGLEIRQNTMAMERQIRVEFADNVHGQLAESDHLAAIVTKIMASQDESVEVLAELSEEYDLTEEEAQRWWRHLMQVWIRDEANWIYNNEVGCSDAAFRLRYRDQQILFENLKSMFDPEFIACIESKTAGGDT